MEESFPVLEFLDSYDLRTAYVILMLGARSGSHFQRLCEEVVPPNCRLSRSQVINLKHERERLLSTGNHEEQTESRCHHFRPSDDVLLREFNRARSYRVGRDKASLTRYFTSLLCARSENHDPSHRVPVGWDIFSPEYQTTVRGIEFTTRFLVTEEEIEAEPPEGVELPAGTSLRRRRIWLRAVFVIDNSKLDPTTTQELLQLPEWELVLVYPKHTMLFSYSDVTGKIEAPSDEPSGVVGHNDPALPTILSHLATLGINIASCKPIT